jgi:hypothetical protein
MVVAETIAGLGAGQMTFVPAAARFENSNKKARGGFLRPGFAGLSR